jgi:hypothetical protein
VREGRAEALKGAARCADRSTRRSTASSTTTPRRCSWLPSRGWWGWKAPARDRQIRLAGAIHGAYSTLTDYPLGIAKLIPFRAHLATDAVGAVALGAAPFVSGEYRRGLRHWVPHVALSLFELGSLALTDPTGEGDFHGDIEAIRRGNSEQPHRKIHEGGLAVTPAHA